MKTTKKTATSRIKRTEVRLAPAKAVTSRLTKPVPGSDEDLAYPDTVSLRCPMKAERGELRVWALMYFLNRYEIRLLGLHPTRYHAQMARYEYLREGEKHEGELVNPDHARRHAVAPIEMMCEIVDEGEGPVLKLTGSLPTKDIKTDDE